MPIIIIIIIITIILDGRIIQRIIEAKVMFSNTRQLLCSKNLTLEVKKKLINVVFGVLLFMDQKYGPQEK